MVFSERPKHNSKQEGFAVRPSGFQPKMQNIKLWHFSSDSASVLSAPEKRKPARPQPAQSRPVIQGPPDAAAQLARLRELGAHELDPIIRTILE